MSFLLRFIKIWLLALWHPKAKPSLTDSLIHLRVWPNDLDLNIHVNNGRYLTLMDLGRMDLMFRSGAMRLWIKHGWQPLVGTSMCRHFKALRVFQKFELETKVLGWDEKWIYFEQRFTSQGQLYAIGIIKGLMAGKTGPIPTAEILSILGIDEASGTVPAYVHDWLKAERGIIDALKAEKHA